MKNDPPPPPPTQTSTGLSRGAKRWIMVTADLVMIPLALWSAFALRLGDLAPPIAHLWWLFILAPTVSIPIFLRLGLYHALIRFMGQRAAFVVIKGITLSAMALAALTLLSGANTEGIVPRSAFLIYWGVGLIYVGGSRFLMRAYLQGMHQARRPREPVVIYGAGEAGVQLAAALSNGQELDPVAFVDDKPVLHGSLIGGIRVYPPTHLPQIINERDIGSVLLAMPSIPRAQRRAVVEALEPYPVHVRTVPGLSDLVAGSAQVDEIQEIDIDDVLGREPIPPKPDLLDACVRGKTVLVTGAGGSIGSELCRQLLRLAPSRLVLFERSEYALYTIDHELEALKHKEELEVEVVSLLGSVMDRRRLAEVIDRFDVHTLYHAAAYKHVPLVEHNIVEGVRNNILGTLQCALAARDGGVEHMVLISTDKAVRPTNMMGASKRFAELVLQGLSGERPATRFSMVRFGNVLGSSGSVVPKFREQIRRGGPVTVTHPEINRYFMTIPEAAQLVIQAGSMAEGGDVFVLEMGEPVRIADLARKMIHLAGREVRDEENPQGDIKIQFTGLRPGEKLYEELLIGNNPMPTRHPRILRAEEASLPWPELEAQLEQLAESIERGSCEKVRELVQQVVREYRPNGGIEDLLYHRRADDSAPG